MGDDNALKNFYRDLLSNDWERRLYAYSLIESDLKARGIVLSDDAWEDMTLLVGQILSIYFKKKDVRNLEEFKSELTSIYKRLLSPLLKDKSKNYADTQALLASIYDKDDPAKKDITNFFENAVKPKDTALFNLFQCYEFMMQKVMLRTQKMAKNMANKKRRSEL